MDGQQTRARKRVLVYASLFAVLVLSLISCGRKPQSLVPTGIVVVELDASSGKIVYNTMIRSACSSSGAQPRQGTGDIVVCATDLVEWKAASNQSHEIAVFIADDILGEPVVWGSNAAIAGVNSNSSGATQGSTHEYYIALLDRSGSHRDHPVMRHDDSDPVIIIGGGT